jgi:hypothetical protein
MLKNCLKNLMCTLCQTVPFVLACFQASAAPRTENSDSDEKDALFGLDIQISISNNLLVLTAFEFYLFQNSIT